MRPVGAVRGCLVQSLIHFGDREQNDDLGIDQSRCAYRRGYSRRAAARSRSASGLCAFCETRFHRSARDDLVRAGLRRESLYNRSVSHRHLLHRPLGFALRFRDVIDAADDHVLQLDLKILDGKVSARL